MCMHNLSLFRTDRNVHLFLHDIESDQSYCNSGTTSNRVSFFFRTGFVRSASLILGGASSNIQVNSIVLDIKLINNYFVSIVAEHTILGSW